MVIHLHHVKLFYIQNTNCNKLFSQKCFVKKIFSDKFLKFYVNWQIL